MSYTVGQRVWIFSVNSRGHGPRAGTVTKVGRKLVTVDRGWYGSGPTAYRMEDGTINDNYGHEHIKTDEEKEVSERLSAVLSELRDRRVHGLPATLSVEALEKIAAVIREDLEPAERATA